MYMNLEHRLQYIGDMPPTGTLAVIAKELDFRKTDAFIQFLKLALDQIPNAYGTQNPEWQKRITRVYKAAERLQTAYTWFAGDTHDALNLLIALGVYIINCSSTREKDCYSFDTQRVHNDLRHAQSIIERIEFVN